MLCYDSPPPLAQPSPVHPLCPLHVLPSALWRLGQCPIELLGHIWPDLEGMDHQALQPARVQYLPVSVRRGQRRCLHQLDSNNARLGLDFLWLKMKVVMLGGSYIFKPFCRLPHRMIF